MGKSEENLDVISAVSNHIEKHIGKVETVFHEIVSPDVHIDVHIVAPTVQRPYYVAVTSGMSEKPMDVPEDASDGRFAEVLICLPPTWPMTEEAFKQESNWWPIGLLKHLARYPHACNTWLYWGHSLVKGDPPEPYAPNTRMSSVVLLKPRLFPDAAHTIHLDSERRALLWAAYPLYQEELNLKIEEGAERLEELFDTHGVTELLDEKRPSVVRLN